MISFPDTNTNPGATNALRFATPAADAGGVHLQWRSQPATQYRVFYSDDLTNWLLLQTPVTAGQNTASLLDPTGKAQTRRFYRVKSIQ